MDTGEVNAMPMEPVIPASTVIPASNAIPAGNVIPASYVIPAALFHFFISRGTVTSFLYS